MTDFVLRFLIGGVVVSGFAVLGDLFRPKSFAGLFGAAPSVALATLGLTIAAHGKGYSATEARSMVGGAIAFFAYACATSWVLMRYKPPALLVTVTLLPIWLTSAFAVWLIWLR